MIFCVLGNPIKHSLSPKLFRYIFNKLNIKHEYYKYLINDIDELTNFINQNIIEKQINGLNITAPYKVQILSLLDKFDSSVKDSNSCNCIKITNSNWKILPIKNWKY